MISTILVVEDDKDIQEYITQLLLDHNLNVITATNGATALKLIKKTHPDLVILDLGLPDISGESILMQLHKEYPDLRIIILTARDSMANKIQGLNLGADDYLTKPFNGEELIARIQARLRRLAGSSDTLRLDDLEFNTKTLVVTRGGKEVSLTPQETKLLQYLMQNQGRILTREMILNRLWMSAIDVDTRIVDVYIGYLRKKIDRNSKRKLIHSVRGFGYILKSG
ncbi:MAG: response regulator transcription factor [Patescibacteria group bacterium]|nr:response regulator transcription factor [Patescibacteria group bacterium]